MTVLGDHAISELAIIDAPSELAAALTTIVGTFADVSNPATNWPIMRDWLDKLLKMQPLSPISADPSQWTDRFEQAGNVPMWQSTRNPDAWTRDSTFATYFLMSEAGDELAELHDSDPYTP
jgi:hypothetical protein